MDCGARSGQSGGFETAWYAGEGGKGTRTRPHDPCSLAGRRHQLHIDWSVSRDSCPYNFLRALSGIIAASRHASRSPYMRTISQTSDEHKALLRACPHSAILPRYTQSDLCIHAATRLGRYHRPTSCCALAPKLLASCAPQRSAFRLYFAPFSLHISVATPTRDLHLNKARAGIPTTHRRTSWRLPRLRPDCCLASSSKCRTTRAYPA
jgi:hypothetical protein